MMTRKGVKKGFLLFAAILLFVTPAAVSAEEASSSTATSQGSITITSEDTVTPPIEPSEPGGETGNEGTLTIDNVSPLLFASHTLAGGDVTYTTTTKNPNVQVTDIRGTGAGWTLQVSATPFKDKTDNTKVLKGAIVTLPIGMLITSQDNVSTAPTAKQVQLSTDSDVTAPENLMVAKADTGLGTWVDKFDASEVTIQVPAGNLTGDYVSTLYWSLLDAPQ
ncbi:WxL domain-containing protein [Paenibacillus thiaminolyticus]|uniref:WxL domain-containing protein n=1 Tax=Paenibacillus thiaminolyticus TaxID=49283 RepID=UPI003D29E221